MRTPVSRFLGLNTVSDPKALGLSFQSQIDNADISQDGRIVRRQGYAEAVTGTSVTGAYATKDEQRSYIVDAGDLLEILPDLTTRELDTGLSSGRWYFDEVNGQVFGTNGTDYRIIYPNGRVKAWGVPPAPVPAVSLGTGVLPAGFYRIVTTLTDEDGLEGSNSEVAGLDLTGDQQIIIQPTQVAGYTTNVYVTTADGTVFYLLAENATSAVHYSRRPDQLGRELRFWFTNGPQGTLPCFWQGQCYLAEYYPDQDASALWYSLPLHYHHFDIGKNGHAVPGRVLMLKAVPGAVIIGTDRAVHAWDGSRLTTLCDYGVVEGHHDSMIDGRLLFWTVRGLCAALPFENLTERTVSVAPGTFAGATVIKQGGNVRYVVALVQGGEAYNAY